MDRSIRDRLGHPHTVPVVHRPALARLGFDFRFHRQFFGSVFLEGFGRLFHTGLHFLMLGDFALDGLEDCALC